MIRGSQEIKFTSQGKILDDNSVIATLEKLKTEAADIAAKSAETDKVEWSYGRLIFDLFIFR